MKKIFGVLILGVFFITLWGCVVQPQTPDTNVTVIPTTVTTVGLISCEGPAIIIGQIADDPTRVISDTQPLLNYLAERLSAYGIECGRSIVPETVDEMITAMKNDEADIVMDSMFPSMLISDATGAQPILRRWRNCVEEYYSVVFTKEGTDINAIEDLRGHMIAMDTPDSTSGFILPAVYLMDHGLKLSIKESFDDPVAPDEVGIYFSYADKDTLFLVVEEKVSAGATDDDFFAGWENQLQEAESLTATPEQGKSISLIKLAETISVPRQVVLIRPNMDGELQDAIKQELLNCESNPECKQVMEKTARTCKFDEPPEGIMSVFEQMRQMYAKIKGIPGWEDAFTKASNLP